MVREYVDTTGRFAKRPHYEPHELDRLCENLIVKFLRSLYSEVTFPVSTDDLTKLIEKEARDLDQYADLTNYGPQVEGVTLFEPGKKPIVKISSLLSENEIRENRFRTTLAHEYGHVHLHRYLFDLEAISGNLPRQNQVGEIICKRDSITNARLTDWMEWQACYFSGALLMPKTFVKRVFDAFNQDNCLNFVADGSIEHTKLIERIKESFQVSEEAAKVRLATLHLTVTPETAPVLFRSTTS